MGSINFDEISGLASGLRIGQTPSSEGASALEHLKTKSRNLCKSFRLDSGSETNRWAVPIATLFSPFRRIEPLARDMLICYTAMPPPALRLAVVRKLNGG